MAANIPEQLKQSQGYTCSAVAYTGNRAPVPLPEPGYCENWHYDSENYWSVMSILQCHVYLAVSLNSFQFYVNILNQQVKVDIYHFTE